jgi:catechol 2,3-dioxygenase-like lactoylglutathione lyase family enzyme
MRRVAVGLLIGLLFRATLAWAKPQRAVVAVGMTVADMDRSVAFYTQVLGFQPEGEVEVAGGPYEHLEGVFGLRIRIRELRLGNERLVLTHYLVPRGRPFPADSHSNDRWFQHIAIVVSNMDRAYALLKAKRVDYASSGPQKLPRWNPNAGGIRAFYFRDTDVHYLEIIQFPPDKGDPRWQRSGGKLFLGIDHSAIVVANTDASLAFYRDLLGFNVAGRSENYGDEQEHLNNVFGARLRITTLRCASGPGIELLEYLTPRDGRPIPADLRPNDLAFWRVMLTGPTAPALERLRATLTATPGHELGFSQAALIHDPDGHSMELIEP